MLAILERVKRQNYKISTEAKMKKFIISVLCVAVFFIGLGNLVEETGARFKSDERALALIKQAQTAIGGEAAIGNVRSLTMNGTVAKTFDLDGATRTEQGELEINLQLPNQFARMMKLRHPDGSTGEKSAELKKEVNVIVMNNEGEAPILRQIDPNGQKSGVFVVKKGDVDKAVLIDKNVDGKVRRVITDENIDVLRANGGFHQNEMFRTTLALLLSAPQGTDVTFVYAGDGDVDGNSCDVVEARTGDSTIKLFLNKSSHLPVMMSYQGHKPMIFRVKRDMKNEANSEQRVLVNKLDKPEMAEFQIRFSDYRAVGGVLLPHRWTQTVGGNADEIVDVTSFEINPTNIAEKFQNRQPKVFIRSEGKAQ
jgi:hypothetical protein